MRTWCCHFFADSMLSQPLCVCRSAKPQASGACKVLCFEEHMAGTCFCLRVPGTVKRSLWHGIKECASLLPWG